MQVDHIGLLYLLAPGDILPRVGNRDCKKIAARKPVVQKNGKPLPGKPEKIQHPGHPRRGDGRYSLIYAGKRFAYQQTDIDAGSRHCPGKPPASNSGPSTRLVCIDK